MMIYTQLIVFTVISNRGTSTSTQIAGLANDDYNDLSATQDVGKFKN